METHNKQHLIDVLFQYHNSLCRNYTKFYGLKIDIKSKPQNFAGAMILGHQKALLNQKNELEKKMDDVNQTIRYLKK